MPRNDLKAYTSVIARIPRDLAAQVKRYAREHRSSALSTAHNRPVASGGP